MVKAIQGLVFIMASVFMMMGLRWWFDLPHKMKKKEQHSQELDSAEVQSTITQRNHHHLYS